MVLGQLVAKCLIVFPGLGHVVAELVEQRLVVPEQNRREVVAKAIDGAIDRHRVERAGSEAIEEALVQHALVEGRGERLHTIGLLGSPGSVVVLCREHHVRPTLACLVGKADLGLECARGTRRAVIDDGVDLDLGVRCLERLDGGLAGGVDPHGDRIVGGEGGSRDQQGRDRQSNA